MTSGLLPPSSNASRVVRRVRAASSRGPSGCRSRSWRRRRDARSLRDLSCATSSTLRADSQHTSHITKSKGTEMKIVVIGGTGLIGSKRVAAIMQVNHA